MKKKLLSLVLSCCSFFVSFALNPPTPLAPTDYGFSLNWTSVPGATSYNVFVKNSTGALMIEYPNVVGIGFAWCPEDNNGVLYPMTDTYTFFVETVSGSTTSAMSAGYSFQLSAPATPTNITISSPVTPSSVISWSVPGVQPNTDYDLQLVDLTTGVTGNKWIGERASAIGVVDLYDLNSQSMPIGTNLIAGHSYQVNVYAHLMSSPCFDIVANHYGSNPTPGSSSVVVMTCPAMAAPTLSFPPNTNITSTLTWARVAGAGSYNIAWADLTLNPGATPPSFTLGVGGYSSTEGTSVSPIGNYISPQVTGHTYIAWVQAVNNCSASTIGSATFVLSYPPPQINGGSDIFFSKTVYSLNGTITAVAGQLVTINFSASGPPSGSHTMNFQMSGAYFTSGGYTVYITNTSTSETFTMPAGGSVSWAATFLESDSFGSGTISVN